jgi:hypothetical protein
MKLSLRTPGFVLLGLPIVVGLGVASTSGSPGGYSSAPGQSNCTACHGSFPLDTGPNDLLISVPATKVGLTSVPIQVSFASTSAFKHGFELAARDVLDLKVGTLQITDATNTKLVSNNVTHTSTGSGKSTWATSWTPSGVVPAGPITFYASGLEGNGGGTSGDYVYTALAKVYQAQISTPAATWPLGTTQPLTLKAPTRPGDDYIVALSDGTSPTVLPGGLVIPIDLSSSLFLAGITTPAFFQNFIGTLDAAGNAQAQVLIPPLPFLSGFVLHFAFAAVAPGQPLATEVSNRITVTLL